MGRVRVLTRPVDTWVASGYVWFMSATATTTGIWAQRPGGDHRGSAASRRARKHWMLKTWGNGKTCPCVHCQTPVTFDTVEADRIISGGPYARPNIQPSCKPCNQARSNKQDWTPTTPSIFALAA